MKTFLLNRELTYLVWELQKGAMPPLLAWCFVRRWKTSFLFGLCAICFVGVASAESSAHPEMVAASQKRAIAAYPELAKPGSLLNLRFLSEWRRLQAAHDPLLKHEDWPQILAQRCAQDLNIPSPAPGAVAEITATQATSSLSAGPAPSASKDITVEDEPALRKYRMHVTAKILIFRADGVIARIAPMWNRPIEDDTGQDTGKVYPDKFDVGDYWTTGVFIECTPPANVATLEETEMYIYPSGILQERSTRYRRFTTNAQSCLDYIKGGGDPSTSERVPNVTDEAGKVKPKLTGAISNRGRSAVAAMGTPFGRYNKLVEDAVGMRWYYSVAQRADLIERGTVRIHFVISDNGHVHDTKVMSGNANGALADISLQAINEAEIPPIPREVAATLDGNQMDVDYDFSEY